MKTESCAALSTTFRILQMTDELSTATEPDSDRLTARRILVMINKYRTAVGSTTVARDAIEILGGNGTIEEFSVLPRLYRDAIVIESWEGTHNTLCLQVLRDFALRQMHIPWLKEMRRMLNSAPRIDGFSEHCRRAERCLQDLEARIEKLLSAPEEQATVWIRDVVDRMWDLFAYLSLLLEAAAGDAAKIGIVDYFRRRRFDPVDDMGDEAGLQLETSISSVL
jgi:acyl-CoA dehydrogenase